LMQIRISLRRTKNTWVRSYTVLMRSYSDCFSTLKVTVTGRLWHSSCSLLMMKSFLLLLLLASQLSSFSQDCKDLPSRYSSSSEAINRVKNSTFVVRDKLPDDKSQKIVSANYYSCDGESGYLIYVTGRMARSYIHTQVPKKIWLEFKNAVSSEAYYDRNIKDKYKIELKQAL
jgi:hypothetical protein